MNFYIAIIILSVLGTSQALIVNGTCRTNVAVKSTFNPNMFTGTWFVNEGYLHDLDDCMTMAFTEHRNGFRIFANAQIKGTEKQTISLGTAELSFPNEPRLRPIFNVTLGLNASLQMQVMDTDYTHYALLWGCQEVDDDDDSSEESDSSESDSDDSSSEEDDDESYEYFVFLTRQPGYDLDPITAARVEDLIDRFINRFELQLMVQDKATCLGWPEPYLK